MWAGLLARGSGDTLLPNSFRLCWILVTVGLRVLFPWHMVFPSSKPAMARQGPLMLHTALTLSSTSAWRALVIILGPLDNLAESACLRDCDLNFTCQVPFLLHYLHSLTFPGINHGYLGGCNSACCTFHLNVYHWSSGILACLNHAFLQMTKFCHICSPIRSWMLRKDATFSNDSVQFWARFGGKPMMFFFLWKSQKETFLRRIGKHLQHEWW